MNRIVKKQVERVACRLWEKVERLSPDQCWPWVGYLDKHGYGRININGVTTLAHRVAWMLTYGRIPVRKCVLHVCDNPVCMNPSHLKIGTQADNMIDKAERKRTLGVWCGKKKLNDEQVAEIRAKRGIVSQYELARQYNITQGHVANIQANRFRTGGASTSIEGKGAL